jgi:hypothetical protein
MENKTSNYRPIFIDRKTGIEYPAGYTLQLNDSDIIGKQLEYSTAKIIFMLKKED